MQNQAPPFSARDYRGHQVQLSDYTGRKVLLSFFRSAFCPFCNLRTRDLMERSGAWKAKGLEVVCFFPSTAEEIAAHPGRQDPSFALLADPKEVIYQRYQIQQSKKAALKSMARLGTLARIFALGLMNLKANKEKPLLPTDLLLDESHRIIRIYQGLDFGDHLSLKDIEDFANNRS